MTHRSPTVHRDPIPPTRPPRLVDDGYYQEPEPVRRQPYQGWELDRPVSHRFAWFGLGVCVGILVFALIWTIGRQLDAASGSGQTTDPIDLSRASSAALSPASHVPAAATPRAEAPVPSPSGATSSSFDAGWATFCRPTSTRCQSWGEPALLGAVQSFTWGDAPYVVRVVRTDGSGRSVDVTVVSHCGCGIRDGRRTVIDLSPAAMAVLEPDYARIGVVLVEVHPVGAGVTLPPTDDQSGDDPPPHPDDERMRDEVRGDELYR